ncbi:MAG: ATP-binding protein [Kiritimatiellae bacterium]|nr:ATP-binding protein [Kiritimatiellia bacterium]
MAKTQTTHITRHGAWRLEFILLIALLTSALLGGGVLVFLKVQHDKRAHLAATETVLQEGESLLNTLCELGLACSTNPVPSEWRRFSTIVDSAFSVRQDVQSVSVSRNGVTVFHRQAGGLRLPPTPPAQVEPTTNQIAETEMSQGSIEIGGVRQPVFVISRTSTLRDGSKVVTEATFKREAVGNAEFTARSLVSSLFTFSITVLVFSFTVCALALTIAVTRDRRREQRARQEEHLAFSGVLANGILHDFRNPMSSVRLDAQMLVKEMKRGDGFRPERVSDLSERIARTMERMDKVFKEFLFLAKPADEQPEGVDLEHVVRECADTLAPRSEQAGVTVKISCLNSLPPVSAFPFALRRALMNVLVNAVQFAPKGSEITVTLAQRGPHVVTDVLDRGPGIPPEKRQNVFDMFVTGRPEGTGLGLFLARTAIRRCNGDIQALPREGGGADLRITLPAIPNKSDRPAAPLPPTTP